ncbi:hypothetical protein ACFQH5_20100 [Halomonas salifodinae]|uniref:Uncharacterized protein n=1 Tax=Halomonas salifodinae TaxID=438745 RepID=A0ABW2F0W1_9GAMM
MMTREKGLQRSSAEGDAPDSPLEQLKGSVREYTMPLEPVAVDDWEALDDAAAPRGDS